MIQINIRSAWFSGHISSNTSTTSTWTIATERLALAYFKLTQIIVLRL